MRKQTLTTTIGALLMGSMALTAQAAPTDPQGMYSADDIMDADVYFANDPAEEIGEVDDILFDEEMRIAAIVVESGSVLGMGGREMVVETDYFSLETETESDGETEHRIMLDASQEEVEGFPTYDHDWWEQTKASARDAWQSTKEGAESAWQSTRAAINDND